MLTDFVLTSVAAGGLAVMTAPLFFKGLLALRYPATRGEVMSAFAPQTPARSNRRTDASLLREYNSLALHRSNMGLCAAVHPRAVVGSDHVAEVERQRACPASSPAMPT
jgi:hypothetical protein